MKLLVVDDHPVALAGLAAVLRGMEPDVVVVEATTGDDALRIAADGRELDAVFVDLFMPDMDGWSLLSALAAQCPSLPIVVVSASDNPKDARKALALGALGYLPKSSTAQTIVSAFRLILSGNVYVPPLLLHETDGAAPHASSLTHRQLEVLRLLCDGRSNKEICTALGLSERTVKAHLTSIFRALHVETRTQAALAARESGIVAASG